MDSECTDALDCNGLEHCTAGQCQAGTALACPVGLQCVEHGPGASSCDFPLPGRWLTFLGNDTGLFPFELRGLRVTDGNRVPSVSLSTGVVDASYQLIDIDTWSPNGRYLIVNNVKDLSHFEINRLFVIQFGAGLPGAPTPLKDIPVGSSVASGPWAADSSAVFVLNYSTPFETYLVRFTPAGAMRTELLFSELDETSDLGFCPDARWFYRTVGDDSWLVDSQQPDEEQFLWRGTTYQSPDRHSLLNSEEDTGLWVASCEPDTQPVQLSEVATSGPFRWSKDGRFLAITRGFLDDEIEVLDSQAGFQSVFKGAEADYRWAPKSSKLMLLGKENADGVQALTELDLRSTPPRTMARGVTPPLSEWDMLNDDTVWGVRAESAGLSGCWLLEQGASAWRLLASELSSASPSFTADEAYAVFRHELNDGTKQLLAFPLHSESPMPLALLPTPVSGDLHIESLLDSGLLVSRSTNLEPFAGQISWIGRSAGGFNPPVVLNDVRVALQPQFQPLP